MLKHLFKLIWNKKKQNFLLMLEIFVSFLGLFAGFTAILYPYNNYKLPLGFEDRNVWYIHAAPVYEIKNLDSLLTFRETIKKSLLAMHNIEAVSYSSANIPFLGNSSITDVKFSGNSISANAYAVEESYLEVLGMKVLAGRWFTKDDRVSSVKPVVINEKLKTKLFGTTPPIGQILGSDAQTRMKVIGVVEAFKAEGEEEAPSPGFFVQLDTSGITNQARLLVKLKQDADVAYEGTVHQTLANQMTGADIEITRLTDLKEGRNKSTRMAVIIGVIIAGFLIINVALGIFGVLWYNTHKRKGEIGLRRAIGATGQSISKQLLTEAILLATLSMVLGMFFAIQFPLLQTFDLPVRNFVIAMILSIISIYVLVIVCAWYPGKQAASIYPATALHED